MEILTLRVIFLSISLNSLNSFVSLSGGVNISNAAQVVHIGHNITIGSDKRQENVENIIKTPGKY